MAKIIPSPCSLVQIQFSFSVIETSTKEAANALEKLGFQ